MWINGPFLVLFSCLIVNIYSFCSFRTYYFSNFNLYAFRGTDTLQPNSYMVHKHLARARMTKWVLERREIRLISMCNQMVTSEIRVSKSKAREIIRIWTKRKWNYP